MGRLGLSSKGRSDAVISHTLSGALCVRGVHSFNKHCVAVYRLIPTRFSAFLFQNGLLFQMHYIVLILSLGDATIFAKLRSKTAKSPKIGGKVCAHQIAERFKENSTAVV